MSTRKLTAIMAIATMAFAACSSSGSSAAPSAAGSSAAPSAAGSAAATGCKVGVAWATFQEERYGLRDEPGSRRPSRPVVATYTGNDAKNSTETQATNVEALIAAGVNVLVVNAQSIPRRSCRPSRRPSTPGSRSSPMTASSRTRRPCS